MPTVWAVRPVYFWLVSTARSAASRAADATGKWPVALVLDQSGQGAALGRGRIGLALAESQVAAIRLALMSKVLIITGGPGVGKTTLVNAILRILAAKRLSFCCALPPAARPNACPRQPAPKPRPFTGCWRCILRVGVQAGKATRSNVTCWWWTRPRWSMSP